MSNLIIKLCPKCKNEYPLTSEFWCKDKTRKTGFRSPCKNCQRLSNRERYENNPEYHREKATRWRNENPERVRELRLSRQDKDTQYRHENPEVIKRAKDNYRNKNRDLLRKKNLDYYYANKDKSKEHHQVYYENNRDSILEKKRAYNRTHREKLYIYDIRRRARKMQSEGSFTEFEVQELYEKQNGKCFHCGDDLSVVGFHRDHWIPLSKGGSNWISNIRLLCPYCNRSKHNKLPCEWNERYCE